MVQCTGTMNKQLNGNGHGGGHSVLANTRQIAQKKPASWAGSTATVISESRVTFRAAEGAEVHGRLVHFNRRSASFELFGETILLRSSETLTEFQIQIHGQRVYY